LRYPGGKTKLLSFLVSYLPKYIPGKYVEPFLGGGSVFLHVQPEEAIIADLNKELIELYKGIKDHPNKVWEIFESFPIGRKAYYEIRDKCHTNESLHYRAARILYLNRTCFKGMWRHNPQGKFNVGYGGGGEGRRWAINCQNIIELSDRFKNAQIIHADFNKTLSKCSDGDFIFLDPPYKPGEKEMREAHYINGRFSFDDQKRLALRLTKLSHKKDIKWIMTNSSNAEICKLYSEFKIISIPQGTGSVVGVSTSSPSEILISNF